MAKGKRAWGYDHIAEVLAHRGQNISDQTLGNILKRRGAPLPLSAKVDHVEGI